MRWYLVLVLSLLLAGCPSPGPAPNPNPNPQPQPEPEPPPPDIEPAFIKKLIAIHNENRGSGRPSLKGHPKLHAAAQKHAEWMARTGRMSHRGEGFSDPGDRISKEGYNWSTYGENVAWGYNSEESVMRGWMTSPGHRRNIMNSSYRDIGCGMKNNYWCVVFGAGGSVMQSAEAPDAPPEENLPPPLRNPELD